MENAVWGFAVENYLRGSAVLGQYLNWINYANRKSG
jgi:hypothetical protein